MSSAVAFTIFGYEVLWYGLVYTFGFLFTYIYFIKYFYHKNINESQKDISFFIFVMTSLICARLVFCFFYFPTYYLQNPIDILKVYEGGMSIHGGFIGFFLSAWFVSLKYKIPLYKISDFMAFPLMLSLAFGRIGNFMNQELVGIPTQSSIGVVFPEYDELKRYPYQLFASFKNLVVFQIGLYLYLFKQLKEGVLTLVMLFLYSFGRFFIDFIREPTTLVFNFPLGQWISIIFMIVILYLLFKIYNKGERGIYEKSTQNNYSNNQTSSSTKKISREKKK